MMLPRTGIVAAVVLLGGTIGVPRTASFDLQGHQSSLCAKVTMTDGSWRTIDLQGVGCTSAMCSRVRVRDSSAHGVWLDGLASINGISQNSDGSVHAVFTFRDGSSRETAISASNRVLYIGNRFWTHQLDLAGVKQIEFE
jgi:hypothetical protein